MAAGDIQVVGPIDIPGSDTDYVVTGTANSAVINALQGQVVVADKIVCTSLGNGKVFYTIVKAA